MTKSELQEQVEALTGWEVAGEKVKTILRALEREGVTVYWGPVERLLDERF